MELSGAATSQDVGAEKGVDKDGSSMGRKEGSATRAHEYRDEILPVGKQRRTT